jgi:hypothetical protein
MDARATRRIRPARCRGTAKDSLVADAEGDVGDALHLSNGASKGN